MGSVMTTAHNSTLFLNPWSSLGIADGLVVVIALQSAATVAATVWDTTSCSMETATALP